MRWWWKNQHWKCMVNDYRANKNISCCQQSWLYIFNFPSNRKWFSFFSISAIYLHSRTCTWMLVCSLFGLWKQCEKCHWRNERIRIKHRNERWWNINAFAYAHAPTIHSLNCTYMYCIPVSLTHTSCENGQNACHLREWTRWNWCCSICEISHIFFNA